MTTAENRFQILNLQPKEHFKKSFFDAPKLDKNKKK